MNEIKESIKNAIIDLVTSPQVFLPVGAALAIIVLFLIACQRIRIKDKSGTRVKPGTKASQIIGEMPGVQWPEPSPPSPPGSMIVPGMTATKTRMIFLPGPGRPEIDITPAIKSVSFVVPEAAQGGDTQPIEVTSDGEARRQEHRSGDDQDRGRTRADRRTNAARRSRARRRSQRRER